MTTAKSLPNIILFTRGTKGDLYPFLKIGRGFKERNCKVNFLSNLRYESYSKQEQFEFSALDDEETFELLNNKPELHTNLSLKLKLAKDHMIAHLEKEFRIIESKVVAGSTAIVAHSNDYLAPLLIAEKLNVPLFLCMLAPSYVHGMAIFEALMKSLSSDLNDIRHRIGLAPIEDWSKWLSGFKQCFALWPDWFSPDLQNTAPELKYLGFLPVKELEANSLAPEVLDFISGKSKLILITHGTSRPFNDDYFRVAINACQRFSCDIIISTPFRNLLPQALPDNVLWVEFCPFHDVLPKVDLLIHHGGIGTLREAIEKGVPQLIIGQGFDRQHNGRTIAQLGLGDWISPSSLSEENLYQKINFLNKQDIISLCDVYCPGLYKDDAVAEFLDTVICEIHGAENSEMSGKYFREKSIDHFKNINLNNANYEVIDEKIIDSFDVENSDKSSISRQEILQKIIKQKIRKNT